MDFGERAQRHLGIHNSVLSITFLRGAHLRAQGNESLARQYENLINIALFSWADPFLFSRVGLPRAEIPLFGGRPQIDTELRALIRRMSIESPLWGAPRIHGELPA